MLLMNEPLLTESKNRHVMFPVEYPDIFDMYKKHVSTFWTADELNFQQDLIDLEKLSENEKYFINHVLAFFAACYSAFLIIVLLPSSHSHFQ